MWDTIQVLAGIAIIVVTLRDVFHTLFHPSSRGVVSNWAIRVLWGIFRGISRNRTERLSLAGPMSLLAVISFPGFLVLTLATTVAAVLLLRSDSSRWYASARGQSQHRPPARPPSGSW